MAILTTPPDFEVFFGELRSRSESSGRVSELVLCSPWLKDRERYHDVVLPYLSSKGLRIGTSQVVIERWYEDAKETAEPTFHELLMNELEEIMLWWLTLDELHRSPTRVRPSWQCGMWELDGRLRGYWKLYMKAESPRWSKRLNRPLVDFPQPRAMREWAAVIRQDWMASHKSRGASGQAYILEGSFSRRSY